MVSGGINANNYKHPLVDFKRSKTKTIETIEYAKDKHYTNVNVHQNQENK